MQVDFYNQDDEFYYPIEDGEETPDDEGELHEAP